MLNLSLLAKSETFALLDKHLLTDIKLYKKKIKGFRWIKNFCL